MLFLVISLGVLHGLFILPGNHPDELIFSITRHYLSNSAFLVLLSLYNGFVDFILAKLSWFEEASPKQKGGKVAEFFNYFQMCHSDQIEYKAGFNWLNVKWKYFQWIVDCLVDFCLNNDINSWFFGLSKLIIRFNWCSKASPKISKFNFGS